MEGKQINVIDNIINAISILNNTDEYLESLASRLSEYDSLISDYEHLIENGNIDEIDLKKFISRFKKCMLDRRKVKKDISLSIYYKNNIGKLRETNYRGILIQGLKNVDEKTNSDNYRNRVLTDEQLNELQIITIKRSRGRPKKEKEGI